MHHTRTPWKFKDLGTLAGSPHPTGGCIYLLGNHLGTLEHFYVLIHWYHHDMIDRTYMQARGNILRSLSTQSQESIPTPMYPDQSFPYMCVCEIFKAVPYNPVHVQVQYICIYYHNIILCMRVTT